jgi:hypothetical protein
VDSGATNHRRAANEREVDAWLRVVTNGTDLSGVELRYTLPARVEPWVRAFSEAVCRSLHGPNRIEYVPRYLDG